MTASPTLDLALRLNRVRANSPLILNITNHVSMNVMANVLLAIGASPAMAHAKQEVAEFAAMAGALTINIGTLSPRWVDAMEIAARAALGAQTPWVLDPVAVGATSYRQEVGAQLLRLSPSVIRGNASEILSLAKLSDQASSLHQQHSRGHGVDSTTTSHSAQEAAILLARYSGAVVAVTGESDLVTDGQKIARIDGGHALMPKVTALGCSLTGVVGAWIAQADTESTDDIFLATTAALASYAVAGELAGRIAQGPGSFSVAFLDTLYALDSNTLTQHARLEITDAR
ncbi:hydroxyethylthiazole kinase [Halomonas halocynthiae]|uniref:hydroxyethylthiazole kinase n=1 Tax=Halomonas halocynthiae TaxID=176290 RepID=UPI0004115ABD|nr:hydroxyethylthiazole kinase [Halomonas halocynthiae]